MTTMRKVTSILLAASAMGLAAPALADVPTPKAVLGHDVGEDYYLANYEDSIRYFQALAKASDRIKLFETGKTTHGRTMVYAVISSPQNIANFDKYKAISKRLARPSMKRCEPPPGMQCSGSI